MSPSPFSTLSCVNRPESVITLLWGPQISHCVEDPWNRCCNFLGRVWGYELLNCLKCQVIYFCGSVIHIPQYKRWPWSPGKKITYRVSHSRVLVVSPCQPRRLSVFGLAVLMWEIGVGMQLLHRIYSSIQRCLLMSSSSGSMWYVYFLAINSCHCVLIFQLQRVRWWNQNSPTLCSERFGNCRTLTRMVC